MITGVTLVLAICFFMMGAAYKYGANNQKGVTVSTGAIVNGKYTEITSGTVGGDKSKYETFEQGGTIFYILAGFMGVICVASAVVKK